MSELDDLLALMSASRPKKKRPREDAPPPQQPKQQPKKTKGKKDAASPPAAATLASLMGRAVAAVGAARKAAMQGDGAAASAAAREASSLSDQVLVAVSRDFRGSAVAVDEAAEARGHCGAAARVVARVAPALAARSAESLMEALASLDAAYHRLRYVGALLDPQLIATEIPAPAAYFGGMLDANACDAAKQLLARLSDGGRALAKDSWELPEAGAAAPLEDNALLALFHARWRETAWISAEWTVAPAKLVAVPKALCAADGASMKGRDPVAPAALQDWRSAQRTWACHEYSFAVPSERALKKLAALRPIVELGAGTGYWAALLRKRGVDVTAYDVRPLPCSAAEARGQPAQQANAFHGRCLAWTRVDKGDAATVDGIPRGSTLFVCYPPPSKGEAFLGDAVRRFKGDTVAVVGEWRGDTATAVCLDALRAAFSCVDRVPLPNWGDTSAELTVWRRIGAPALKETSKAPAKGIDLDACAQCGCASKPLRRCRLTCDFAFCSRGCAAAGAAAQRDALELKFATNGVRVQPDFDSPLHFKPLGAAAAAKSRHKKKKQAE